MKNIINPQKTLLAALISASSLLVWSTPSSAAIRSFTVDRQFNSCGSVRKTKYEAASAAMSKVRQLRRRGYKVNLKNYKIISNGTHTSIKGNGYSTTKTCTTSLVVRVTVDMRR